MIFVGLICRSRAASLDFELVIRVAYDQIDGETTASASLDLADF